MIVYFAPSTTISRQELGQEADMKPDDIGDIPTVCDTKVASTMKENSNVKRRKNEKKEKQEKPMPKVFIIWNCGCLHKSV